MATKASNVILVLLLFTSCNNSSVEKITELESEVRKLKASLSKSAGDLDTCQNGARRTIASIESELKKSEHIKAKSLIEKLAKNHPEATENKKYSKLIPGLDRKIAKAEKERKKQEELRYIEMNANNLGSWKLGYYVDDFNERTKKGFITYGDLYGLFSNSATTDSKLRANIMIDSYTKAAIMLYEYNGKNPVKSYGKDSYHIYIKDGEGKKYSLRADNQYDRLSLHTRSAKALHRILKKGGTVKFKIYKAPNAIDTYTFTIRDADWYYNAYKKLHNIK